MHKVQRMDPAIGRPNCLICERGNTPDEPDSMDEFWVLDMERDVNWGDPAYICKYCCELIAGEVGYVPASEVEKLEQTIKQKNKEIHTVEAERDSLRRRFRTARAGTKAIQSTRKQVA
jgi:hypothetical protein